MAGQITEGAALIWQGGLFFNDSNFWDVRRGQGWATLENFTWYLTGKKKRIVCHGSHFFFSISTAARLIWQWKFIQGQQLIAAHCPFFSSEHGRHSVPDKNQGTISLAIFFYYHRVVVKTLVKTFHCSAALRVDYLICRPYMSYLCSVGTPSDRVTCTNRVN